MTDKPNASEAVDVAAQGAIARVTELMGHTTRQNGMTGGCGWAGKLPEPADINTLLDTIARITADLEVANRQADHWNEVSCRAIERTQAAEAKLAEAMKGLQTIASCESHFPGDVVDIARSILFSIKDAEHG